MLVCVEGNIGSGKSECMRALAAAFPDVPHFPEPLEEWGEVLPLFYAEPSRWALAFNLKVLLGFRRPLKGSGAVVERCPLSCRHVFGQVCFNRGHMSGHEWELFKEYHDALGWKPDVMFFIRTPPDVCLDRVRSRGRECERGVDLEYLQTLDFQYANMLRFAKMDRVVEFDGTLPPPELHAQVIAWARELLGGCPRP